MENSSYKERRPVVTIAALYGASGSVIGPRVATQLGVPLLDREIPQAVAREAGLPDDAIASIDEKPRAWWKRLVQRLGRAGTLSGDIDRSSDLDLQERELRSRIEAFLAGSAISGGVAIGRGGMVVLGTVPWALHVYLGGPLTERLRVRMEQDGIDRATAEKRQRSEDRARQDYVLRTYGVGRKRPGLLPPDAGYDCARSRYVC